MHRDYACILVYWLIGEGRRLLGLSRQAWQRGQGRLRRNRRSKHRLCDRHRAIEFCMLDRKVVALEAERRLAIRLG